MCSASRWDVSSTTACSLIMNTIIRIHLRRRRLGIINLRVSRHTILTTILITVANDVFSLIVVPRMLLGMLTVETVWSKQYLITTLIISCMISTCLSVAASTSTSHCRRFACWNAWPYLLLLIIESTTSILVVLMIHILLKMVIVLMVIGRRMRIWVFTHNRAANKTMGSFSLDTMMLIICLVDISII